MNTYEIAHAIKDEIIGYRRTIHGFAEVGFDMPKTTAFVREKLTEFGYTDIKEVGGGLVTTVGNGGKVFLLRADMDALPMKEDSGLDFAATNGNCHACGHDMHASILLGAAKLLKEHENEIPGTIKLMFQPAEELLTGAQKMVEAGVLENPKVEAAAMCHVNSTNPLGAGLRSGRKAASSNNFRITITGKGAHGAMPERGVDPVYIGAQIVIGLQEMITREVPFTQSAVLTTGHFEGGSTYNIIPSSAIIEGTMRTFDLDTQEHLKKRLVEIAQGIAATYRGSAEVEYACDCPAFRHEESYAADIQRYIQELRERNNVDFDIRHVPETTGSEDFAFVAREVPGYSITLGAALTDAEQLYPLHNPKVRFNEDALPLGAAFLMECATRWLEEHQ